MKEVDSLEILAIIGLGNPGPQYYYHRHSIGFRVVDALAEKYHGSWKMREKMELAEIIINEKNVFLVKPQTFMNTSGEVIPYLRKQDVNPENMLVIHDELEFPFGKIAFKMGGSARGHNGLRSIIAECGPDFMRLRFGIGRPEKREMVPDYVLHNFTEDPAEVDHLIEQAVEKVEEIFKEG